MEKKLEHMKQIFNYQKILFEKRGELKNIFFKSKPDYLAKLSERLLSDLASLDDSQEQITAVTRVEIECIEDVTDIVKTYRIGLAAPKVLEGE